MTMKDYFTRGKCIDYIINLYYEEGNYVDNEAVLNKRLTLIYVEEGSGIMQVNDRQFTYMAPFLYCANETEHVVIPETVGKNASSQHIQLLYLLPDVINGELSLDMIHQTPSNMSITQKQDLELFRFFSLKRKADTKTSLMGGFYLGPSSNQRIRYSLTNIAHYIQEQDNPNWPCRSRSYLLEIFFLLDRLEEEKGLNTQVDMENGNEIAQVLSYLYHNYTEKITIEQLSRQFHMNRTTLSKNFQETVGESIITHLNKLRVFMASSMLRDTLLPVNEIMERVGFHDTAHFLRTFKKYTLVSPREYREQYCWMK